MNNRNMPKKRVTRLLANKAINPIFVCEGIGNRVQTYIFSRSKAQWTLILTQITFMFNSGFRKILTIKYLGILFFFYGSLFGQNSRTVIRGNSDFVVVLDAGHGGFDPGNLGNGYLEKEIALNIVLEIGKYLADDPRIRVVYTRDTDTFVDLYVRGEIANKAKADLFVSIHCDSHNSSAHGSGTFVLGLHANQQNFEIAKKENSVIYLENNYETRYAEYDINSPESVIGLTIMQEEFLDQSIQFAKLVQDHLTGELGRVDRKVKQAGFIVLHQTFMPSALIETGFLTHKSEGAYLNSRQGQKEIGQSIANAIKVYRNGIRANSALSVAAPVKSNSGVEKPPVKTVAEEVPVVKTPEIKNPATTAAVPAKPKQPSTSNKVGEKPEIIFRVQLAALSAKPTFQEAEFSELPFLSLEPYQNMYRVLYGNTKSLKEAQLLQAHAVSKGFSASYVVAYKNGIRVNVSEVLPLISQ